MRRKEQEKGKLVIMDSKPDSRKIFEKIIQLTKKDPRDVRITVIPANIDLAEQSCDKYIKKFMECGAVERNIRKETELFIDSKTKEELNKTELLANLKNRKIADNLRHQDVVMFAGENYLQKIKSLVENEDEDIPVLEAIRYIFNEGGVIAGTESSASVQAEHMKEGGRVFGNLFHSIIYQQDSKDTPADDSKLFLTKGLSFIENSITDTHFIKRGRLGKLIASCLAEKTPIGYGIGEDTALIIDGYNTEIVGSSGILIIDTLNAEIVYDKSDSGPIYVKNIKLHYLEEGDRFNLKTGAFAIKSSKEYISTEKYAEDKYDISMDLFGQYTITEKLTKNLVDNKAEESFSMAVDSDTIATLQNSVDITGEGKGLTTLIRFKQKQDTTGFFEKSSEKLPSDKHRYSVINIYLDIFPLNVVKDSECSDKGLSMILFPDDAGFEIRVFDSKTGKPVNNATVQLKDDSKSDGVNQLDADLISETTTDEFGSAYFKLDNEITTYRIDIYRDNPEKYMILDRITLSQPLIFNRSMRAIYCYVP